MSDGNAKNTKVSAQNTSTTLQTLSINKFKDGGMNPLISKQINMYAF